jgi:hypothetical protein
MGNQILKAADLLDGIGKRGADLVKASGGKVIPIKRFISAAGRKRIAAAQKKRWAKFRAA